MPPRQVRLMFLDSPLLRPARDVNRMQGRRGDAKRRPKDSAAYLSVQVVPFDVELSQISHVPQVARDGAREAVSPEIQSLQTLAIDNHSLRDAPL